MGTMYKLLNTLLWISVIAKVTKTDCPAPGSRENIEVKYPQNTNKRGPFKEYTTLSYYCKKGTVRLRGDATAICIGSRWKSPPDDEGNFRAYQPLICRDKPCPARKPANGNVTVINRVITYSCERGYQLKGRNSSFCRLNRRGDYYVTHPLPQCIKLKDCEYPPDENLILHGDCCYVGDSVDFTCDSDYRMEGSTTLRCQRNGTWNGTLPICNIIHKCEDPGNTTSGTRVGECCEIGSILTYTCNNGYELLDGIQQQIMTCLSNKKWSNKKPACKPMDSPICPTIPLDENNLAIVTGRAADFYLPWEEVEFECRRHYTSDAETMTLMCQDDGQWDENIPVCKPLNPCKRPPAIQRGQILEMVDNSAQEFPIGFEINIECNENYEVKSTNYGSRCLGDDIWENGISNCTLIECRDPGIPANAIRRGDDFHFGKTVTYSCVGDMELIGSETRTCLETKRWSGITPVCDSGNTDCHDPGIPHNTKREGNDFNLGDVVNYSCFKNHIMFGNGTRVCTENGIWTGSEIVCLGPDEYSDKESVAMELEGTMTEIARMSESSIPMSALARSGGIITEDMKGVNVYFMFDASGSITDMQFKQSKSLAMALIRKVGISSSPGGVRVGIIVFNKEAIIKIFPTTDKKSRIVLDIIDKMARPGKAKSLGTNIANALEMLLELIITTRRNKERQNCKDVVFMMTDGNANEGGQPVNQAEELRRKKVNIYVVSIGDKVNEQTLQLITNMKPGNIVKLKNHKEVFDLFSKIVGNQFDYSPCGLDRLKLVKDDSNTKKISNRRKRSAMLGRIVGGKAVKFSWPWMVAIYTKNETGRKFHCGGSIIHKKWILTAAHCFVIAKNNIINEVMTKKALDSKKWVVSVGRTNLNDEKSGLNALVEKVILHPDYDPANYRNDIALMELKTNLQYDIYTRPICLPPLLPDLQRLYKAKERAIVIGWGHDQTDYLNDTQAVKITTNILNELTVPIQPDSTCNKINSYKCPPNPNECQISPSDTAFCAGTGLGGEDACQGDSGGPLMQFTNSNSSGIVESRWFQVGIVSWGVGCGMPGYYGYYSHVASLHDWIVNVTGGIEFEEPAPIHLV